MPNASTIPLQSPQTPLFLRSESVTSHERTLLVTNSPSPWHDLDYAVFSSRDHSNSTTNRLFTVHGSPFSVGQKRTFFDRSGLPLFDLRSRWYSSSEIDLRLPETGHTILSARLRVAVKAPKAEVEFVNGMDMNNEKQMQGQEEGQTKRKLDVWDTDMDNTIHVVVAGGRNIAVIQRITDSGVLAEGQRPPFRLRPKWVVRVAKGVDLALISVVVVIMGQRAGPNPHPL